MSEKIELHQLLGDTRRSRAEQLRIFALLNLGILESLNHGMISADDAVASFFHGENCSFVHAQMRSRTADELMSRGVQLPDLFDALPATIAQREFQRELAQMQALCLTLLEQRLATAEMSHPAIAVR